MFARLRLPWLLPVVALYGLAPAAADQPSRVALAKLGKAATAFVEVKVPGQTGSGTAFCIHPSGLFLTNEHVIARPGTQVQLVLRAGEKDQRVLPATVVRRSKDPDLALLRVNTDEKLPALSLGTVDDLAELAELIAFGFPFGSALAMGRGKYPTISVNTGSVTALRKRNGELEVIQVDITLNPGNSGGPVLDRDGKVVGVVVAGVRGTGINFVIPVNQVARFLEKPDVSFTPPTLTAATLHQPTRFQVKAAQFVPGGPPLAVELRLRAGNEPERTVPLKLVEGVYQATAAVLPKPDGPTPLRVDIRFAAGSVSGTVVDQAFNVGGQSYQLSAVRQFQGRPKGQVTLRTGQTVEGSLGGLDAVPVSFGKQEVRFNLAHATAVTVAPLTDITSVACTIVVTQGGKEVTSQTHTLTIPSR